MSDALDDELARVFAALGRPEARAVIERFERLGAPAFAAYLARRGAPRAAGPPVDGRAYFEDEELLLRRIAARAPELLLAAAAADPGFAASFAGLSALIAVPGPEAARHLLAALGSRHGAIRWLALRGLVARRDPALDLSVLRRALADSDGLVVMIAVGELRARGEPADLAALARVARAEARGVAEAAFDAIEAICARHGLPLPDGHPGARLEVVELEPGAELAPGVGEGAQVRAGRPLAVWGTDEAELVARTPYDGLVVAIERGDDGAVARIVIRRAAPVGR